jgi:tripartite-type tricarboxylate transporter receptor subunit TctC
MEATIRSKGRRATLQAMAGLAGASLLPAARAARFDEFKDKMFRIVVPFPGGMGSDNIARVIAEVLPRLTGATAIVENKPGGNGVIAINHLNRLEPDGLALFLASQSPMAVNAVMFKSLGYDPLKDAKPVALMMRTRWSVIGAADSPHRTFMEHVEAARRSGQEITVAGGSSGYQLGLHLLAKAAGVKMNVVAYNGTPQAMNDVIGGQVAMTLLDTSTSRPLIEAGRLRPLLVIGNERFERYPADVPSSADLGLDMPALSSWNGIYTTGATPLDIRQRVSEVIREVVASEPMQAYIAKGGSQALYAPVEAMEALQIEQIATYRKAMEVSGLQPQ